MIFVCYITVDGPNSEVNSKKYKILKNCINEYANEKILIMGDFNGHTGILDEKVNKNRDRLLNFGRRVKIEKVLTRCTGL